MDQWHTGEVVVSRFPLADENDTRPNRRLTGIEDAARLSLGDFDDSESPASPPHGIQPPQSSVVLSGLAYFVLILAWFGA